MEQVNDPLDFCKRCSVPLTHTQQHVETSNSPVASSAYTDTRGLLDNVEGLLRHYITSAGIVDQARINHLTDYVMSQSKVYLERHGEEGLQHNAIQIAQKLVALDYVGIYTHNVTPPEQPQVMKVQDLNLRSAPVGSFPPLIGGILKSIHLAILKLRQ